MIFIVSCFDALLFAFRGGHGFFHDQVGIEVAVLAPSAETDDVVSGGEVEHAPYRLRLVDRVSG